MNRKDEIRGRLDDAERLGAVTDWYSYAPGDGWTRWIVCTFDGARTYSTREVEAFLDGISSVLQARREWPHGRPNPMA